MAFRSASSFSPVKGWAALGILEMTFSLLMVKFVSRAWDAFRKLLMACTSNSPHACVSLSPLVSEAFQLGCYP